MPIRSACARAAWIGVAVTWFHAPAYSAAMSFKFGMVVLPLMILGMILRDKGPVAKFAKAGAISPSTARRPDTVAIERNDRLHIPGAVKRGVLIALDDGRYYVDMARRRRQRWIHGGALVTLATAAAIAVILLWPSPDGG